ncbi:hypothetical protein [Phenylobacterium aquaticum]|uniref:terminase small subunit-like protein n=4 Tax=Phenylobacterium aquaticum TaxID=1763816 RepID=UPI0026EA6312|nr:hypothetical protein [Phenylobacterium aquaticum]
MDGAFGMAVEAEARAGAAWAVEARVGEALAALAVLTAEAAVPAVGTEGAVVADGGERSAAVLAAVAARGPRGTYVRWSPALGEAIVGRIASGERLTEICREEDMPGRATVKGWMRQREAFAREMRWAVLCGRNAVKNGARSTYHRAVAAAICGRIVEGQSLTRICRDRGMPCLVTVYNWLKRHPDFAEAYGQARELQGHLKFDQIADEIELATPRTAHLAQVRITALRWQAARLAPTAYGVKSETQVIAEARAAAREETRRALRRGG